MTSVIGPLVSSNLNSFPTNKIVDQSKLKDFADQSRLKDFADDKIIVTYLINFVLGRVENIVGKGENAGYQHFLLFPQYFQKASLSGLLKVWILWERVRAPFATIAVFVAFVD